MKVYPTKLTDGDKRHWVVNGGRALKMLLVALLALVLLCTSTMAESTSPVLDYARNTLMLTPETMEQGFNLDSLNLLVSASGDPVITWTDSANSIAYAITGAQDDMLDAYTDMVFLHQWDSCSVFVDNELTLDYDPLGHLDSYEKYAEAVKAYFEPEVAEASAPEIVDVGQDYVLNTNTKKFHFPSCSSVNQMKSKNRQDYHGSRDDLIARGYKPCGNCKP